MRYRRLTHLLLIAILLLGQFGIAWHQQDHADFANGDTCKLCLLSAGLQHAATNTITALSIAAVSFRELPAPQHHGGSVAASGFLARAPPGDLLAIWF